MTTYTFLLKQGTLAEWAANDPVLQRGEPGVEYDTGRMKLGDGLAQWSALPYFTPGNSLNNITNTGPTGGVLYANYAGNIVNDSLIWTGRTLKTSRPGNVNSIDFGFNNNRLLISGNDTAAIELDTNVALCGKNGTIVYGGDGTNYKSVLYTNQISPFVGLSPPYGTTGSPGQFLGVDNNGNIQWQSISGVSGGSQTIGTTGGFVINPNNSVSIGKESGLFQGPNSLALGFRAGQYQDSDSISIGTNSGLEQAPGSIAVGARAGGTSQDSNSVAIGTNAGMEYQGSSTIAIGQFAGQSTQGQESIAIGRYAARSNQRPKSIALGVFAGDHDQQSFSIAIGQYAGRTTQGQTSIAIGQYAGYTGQSPNTIILNATGGEVNGVSGQTSSCYIAPIRSVSGVSNANQFYPVSYNPVTKELTIA